MSSLRQVDLSGNYLTGEIPASIQYLQKLRDVQFDDNFLSGSIPAEINKCAALEGTCAFSVALHIPHSTVTSQRRVACLLDRLPRSLQKARYGSP
jgi:Leucine-rich repeat (LRR) protein